MLASPGRPFDSSNHLYEIKWDGIRVLAFFGKGRIRLQTRRLLDTTHRYPEIVRALRELPEKGSWTARSSSSTETNRASNGPSSVSCV